MWRHSFQPTNQTVFEPNRVALDFPPKGNPFAGFLGCWLGPTVVWDWTVIHYSWNVIVHGPFCWFIGQISRCCSGRETWCVQTRVASKWWTIMYTHGSNSYYTWKKKADRDRRHNGWKRDRDAALLPSALHFQSACLHLCAVWPVSVPPPPSHLCPSATKHQRQGPNPRGSPNPGDYPASSPPLGAALFCI